MSPPSTSPWVPSRSALPAGSIESALTMRAAIDDACSSVPLSLLSLLSPSRGRVLLHGPGCCWLEARTGGFAACNGSLSRHDGDDDGIIYNPVCMRQLNLKEDEQQRTTGTKRRGMSRESSTSTPSILPSTRRASWSRARARGPARCSPRRQRSRTRAGASSGSSARQTFRSSPR